MYPSQLVFLCLASLTGSSTSPRTTRFLDSRHSSRSQSFLSRSETENLKEIFNFVRNAREFIPLTLSILVPEVRSSVADFLSEFAKESTISVYTVKANDLPSKGTWVNRTRLTWVFFVEDIYSLNILIYWQEDLWKASNQYIIIFTEKTGVISWRRIFENLWKRYNVYRTVILTVEDGFRCLTRYLPFDVTGNVYGGVHKTCLKEDPKNYNYNSNYNYISEDRREDVDNISVISANAKLFENFRDLRNYPVDVALFESLMMNVSYDNENNIVLSRVDADVLDSLEKAMKVKFRLNVLEKTNAQGEDPFDRSLRLIEKGKVEIINTGFFVKQYSNFRKFEFTSAIYEDKLCFIAPDSGLVPKAYMPFLPFTKSLWFLLIAYNIVITILWYLLRKYSESIRNSQLGCKVFSIFRRKRCSPTILLNERSSNDLGHPSLRLNNNNFITQQRGETPREIHRCLLSFFDFVETLCYPFPNPDTSVQKAFLFGTLFFGVIMTGLYQSFLVSSLSKPFHYPQLNTVEDVINSDRKVITKYSNLRGAFVDDAKLSGKIHVVNTTTPTYRFAAYEKMIAISRYSAVKFEDLSAYYDADGNPLLHIVDECPVTFMLSYVVRLYSPYRERINSILLRIREAGLIDFWYDKMIYRLELEKKRRKLARVRSHVKLRLEHYSLTFLLLFLGLLGSALIFLGEMYFAGRPK